MRKSSVLKAAGFVLAFSGIILAFLGVEAVGLPQRYPEDQYMVSTREAMENAFVFALIGTFSDMDGLKGWAGAKLYSEPLRIYDVNGKLLFLEFSVVKHGKTVGGVWASASKVLGAPPVYIMQPGVRGYDLDKARSEALRIAKTTYPTYDVIGTLLVCYSFPRMGIMVTLRNPKTNRETKIIIDAADYKLVPPGDNLYDDTGYWSFYGRVPDAGRKQRIEDSEEFRDHLSGKKSDGTGYWSFYGRVPDAVRKQRIEDYKKFRDHLIRAMKQAELNTKGTLDEAMFKCLVRFALLTCTKKTVPLTLHGQETNDYCAVATGQMILGHYGYSYTQAQIAPAMGYHPEVGCPQSGQISGYEFLSGGNLVATLDITPAWSEAKAEVDANRPLKSGILGHARACAGYSRCRWWTGLILSQSLYIYDPWGQTVPGLPHEGRIYWERWDEVTHTNWIYVRPR